MSGSASRSRVPVEVAVVWGDITRVSGDVFVVGHYQGVLPQNAEWALDCALSGTRKEERLLLTDFTRRGVIRGALGDIAFFPWGQGKGVLVAGMGRPGAFGVDELRRLARGVVSTLGRLLDQPAVTTVLVGSGAGTLGIKEAVAGLLDGFEDALKIDPRRRVGRLRIVENSLDRALEILSEVKKAARAASSWKVHPRLREEPGGVITETFGYSMLLAALAQTAGLPERSKTRVLLEGLLRKLPRRAIRRRVVDELAQRAKRSRSLQGLALRFRLAGEGSRSSGDKIPIRISYHTDGERVFSAAITNSVTVAERQLGLSLDAVDRGVEHLARASSPDAARYGRGLGRRIIHSDFVSLFDDTAPLVLDVDRRMARVEWEMLVSPNGSEQQPLGVRRPVARQLRTSYSPRPIDVTAQRPTLKALVIGDPGDAGHSLPHARIEAQKVEMQLKRRGVGVELRIGASVVPEKGPVQGVKPADLDEVVDLLLSGEFDLVHYSGHAEPGGGGWVFKDGVLRAADLDGLQRPPALILANACYSAELTGQPPRGRSGVELVDLVASLADEFFRRGVADYIGTAWAIPSSPAVRFAGVFYDGVLPLLGRKGQARAQQTVGTAVQAGRRMLYDLRETFGEDASAWGAYQHYGDPARRLAFRARG